jgi:photosystem II stability/assembly factor-like uncharacterized protein
MTRDIRIVNAIDGQQVEYDEIILRMGKIMYRDLGIASKMSLFDSGKALIVGSGLRVEPSSGMTVNVPAGFAYQRISSNDIIPVYQPVDQTVTLDAASGSARVDIIEAQIKEIPDKDDQSYIIVQVGPSVERQWQPIKRDIKYYLNVRKQFDTTTTTAATAAIFQSPQVVTTLDLRFKYLISLTIGEDGTYIDIDCRGVDPINTTRQEIIDHINAAVGFTMASTWDTNKIQLTDQDVGQTSVFTFKPPVSDPGVDATNLIFGLAETAYYKYIYTGENAWFKICELDIGTTTTEITATEIRNIDEKSTWASESSDILLTNQIFEIIQKNENGDLFIKNTDNTKDVIVKTNSTEIVRFKSDGDVNISNDLYVGGKIYSVTFEEFAASNWTQRTSSFGSDAIQDIAHNTSNLWVAAGSTGKLATSPDGINWTQRTSSFGTTEILAINHNTSSLWVAAGRGGKLATSPDGINWTQRTSSFGTTDINDIAHNTSNLWVAVADTGKLATSPDGITWTQQTSSFGSTIIAGIAHNSSNLWVAVGLSGKLATSPDGITWTQRTSSFGSTDIFSVNYGNGLWVAVGNSGKLATSPDGITWTQRTSSFGSTNIRDIAHNSSNLWVAVGLSGKLATSPGGINWTQQISKTSQNLLGVAHNISNLWVSVGTIAELITSLWFNQ